MSLRLSNLKRNLLRTTRAPRVNTLLQNLVIPIVADKPSRPVMYPRIEETRAYEVGPDSLRGQLCGNTRGQPDQSVFRSGVRGAGGKAEKRIYGSNVDDSTTAAAG
jgi:hypothetical protein